MPHRAITAKKKAARRPPLKSEGSGLGSARAAFAPSPFLEREAQANTHFTRASHDREVVAPRVAGIEAAVDIQLVEQVLAPELDAVVAGRRLEHEARIEDAVRGFEHRVALRIDLSALVR